MKFTKLQDKLTPMFIKKDEAPKYLKVADKPKTYDWKFGSRSEIKLEGINKGLEKVTRRALELSPVDFGVTCGLRST